MDAALKTRIVYIGGFEPFLRLKFLRELGNAALAGGEYELEQQSGETEIGGWLSAASTAPFGADRRTVVVRQLLRADFAEAEKRTSDFKALPETARLVLVADDETGDDDKQRRLETASKKWASFVKSLGGYVMDSSMDAAKQKIALKKFFVDKEKKISESNLNKILEMTGNSLSRSLEEGEKLVIYAGEDPSISDRSVADLVVPSREYKVFSMLDSILSGNASEATRQLRTILTMPAKFEDMAFRVMFPTIRKELRLLWQARILVESKTNPSSIPESIRELLPTTAFIASEKEWKLSRLMQKARSLDFSQVASLFDMVSQADYMLKGGASKSDALDVLERMVTGMCGIVRKQPYAVFS